MTERMKRLKRLNKTRLQRDEIREEDRVVELTSIFSVGINLYFETESFFRSHFRSGNFPYFVLVLSLVGISLGATMVDEIAVVTRVSLNGFVLSSFNHWLSYWAITIPIGIGLATAWFYIGGWFYDLRVRLSGGKSDIETSRFINLYTMAVPSCFLIMLVTLRTAVEEAPMPHLVYSPVHTFGFTVLFFLSAWSIVVSFWSVITHFKINTVSAVAWFLVVPMLFLIVKSSNYSYYSLMARQQSDPYTTFARPFGRTDYSTVPATTIAATPTTTQVNPNILTPAQRVRSARNVSFAEDAFPETEYTVRYLEQQRDRLAKELKLAEAALETAQYEKMMASLRLSAMGRISEADGMVASELTGWIGAREYRNILEQKMTEFVQPWDQLDRMNSARRCPVPPMELGNLLIDAAQREALLPSLVDDLDAGLWAIEEFLQDLEKDPGLIENVPSIVKKATETRFSAVISQHQINQYEQTESQQMSPYSMYGGSMWDQTLGLELQGIIPIPDDVGPPTPEIEDIVTLPLGQDLKSDSARLLVSQLRVRFDSILSSQRGRKFRYGNRRMMSATAVAIVVQQSIEILEHPEQYLNHQALLHQLNRGGSQPKPPYDEIPAEDAEILSALVDELKTYQAKIQFELAKFHQNELQVAIGKKDDRAILESLYALISLPVGDDILQNAISSAESSFPEPRANAKLETKTQYQCFQRLIKEMKSPRREADPPFIPVVDAMPNPKTNNKISLKVGIVQADFNEDGTMLVLGRSGSTDQIYSYPELKLLGEVQSFAGTVTAFQSYTKFVFSPDNTRMLCTSSSDTVRLYDTSDWSLIRDICIENRDKIGAIAFLENDRFAVATESSIWLFNEQGEAIDSREHHHLMHVRPIHLSGDGERLIYGQNIYSAKTLEVLTDLRRDTLFMQSYMQNQSEEKDTVSRTIAPTGDEAYQNEHAPIWRPLTSGDETTLSFGEDPVWSRDGTLLAMKTLRNGLPLIRFYDALSKKPIYDFAQGDDTNDLTMMPNGSGFAHYDKGVLTICRMSGNTVEVRRWTLLQRIKELNCLFSPDGKTLALTSPELFHADFYDMETLLGAKPKPMPRNSTRPPRPTLPMNNVSAKQ